MTIGDELRGARARLIGAGIPAPEAMLDAELLARHVLGWDRAWFVARTTERAAPDFVARYAAAIERRASREPVAYIRGHQEFWGRDFVVSPAVLIPRPETELVIDEALASRRAELLPRLPRVLDIGTGSGCLAITLALEWPEASVAATDISRAALTIARANAERLAGPDLAHRIDFRHAPYIGSADDLFDLIVSNPPYVTSAAYLALAPEVRDQEPALALVAGDDGLRDIREIVRLAPHHLAPGGRLLMEIGYDQADALRSLVGNTPGVTLARIREDLQAIPRVAVVVKPSKPAP